MIYATSDPHGYPLPDFQRLLDKAGFSDDDFLFVLGDVIDRNGDGGVTMLRWMADQPNIQLIRGNHENMLLSCPFLFEEITDNLISRLDMDQIALTINWMNNGAEPTLNALHELRRKNPDALHDLLGFLSDLPLYESVTTDAGDFVLVHSGFENFSASKPLSAYTEAELTWHRPSADERFFTDVTTVLGHTPTLLYGTPNRLFRTKTWIDIDTGAAMGGSPMLLRLDDLKTFYAD